MIEYLPPPRTLLDGLAMVESGRWHDGRLWFAHWGVGEVLAVDADDPGARAQVTASGPRRMGWSIAWLPDGRLVTTGDAITRHEPDGTTTTLRAQGANEIAIDPAGHVYVDGFDGAFGDGDGFPEPGWIDLLRPDGSSRRVAEDVHFPNGMVITPDGTTLVVAESTAGRLTAFDIAADGGLSRRRVWADGLGPDGIAIDAEGGIWTQTADTRTFTGDAASPAGACVRVLDGGEITHRVETDQPCFACALGGADGRTLFLLCNNFAGVGALTAVQARRSARVLATAAPVPAPRW